MGHLLGDSIAACWVSGKADQVQICPHTEKDIVETPAPHCWVDEGDHEARRSWRAEFRAFTDAWREALAAWVNGARACFPACGWVPFDACDAPAYPQRE